MAPLSATQRESLAAEKAEERLQQLHEEDLRIRRAQVKEIEDRAADRDRKLLQEQEDRTEMLRVRKEQENRAIELHTLSLATATARSSTAASSSAVIDEPGPVMALTKGSVSRARIASFPTPVVSAVARMLRGIASSNYQRKAMMRKSRRISLSSFYIPPKPYLMLVVRAGRILYHPSQYSYPPPLYRTLPLLLSFKRGGVTYPFTPVTSNAIPPAS